MSMLDEICEVFVHNVLVRARQRGNFAEILLYDRTRRMDGALQGSRHMSPGRWVRTGVHHARVQV